MPGSGCPGLAPAPACLAFTQEALSSCSSLTRKLGTPPQPSGWREALGSLYILLIPRVCFHICAKDVTSPAPTSHVGARTRFPLDTFSVESSKASQLMLTRTDAVTLPFLSLALPAGRPPPPAFIASGYLKNPVLLRCNVQAVKVLILSVPLHDFQ